MTSALKDLLFNIRQHPAFTELLEKIERPRLKPYRPSDQTALDVLGAKTSFVSGQIVQDNAWRSLLTGEEPKE
jgi:hypothetical protein